MTDQGSDGERAVVKMHSGARGHTLPVPRSFVPHLTGTQFEVELVENGILYRTPTLTAKSEGLPPKRPRPVAKPKPVRKRRTSVSDDALIAELRACHEQVGRYPSVQAYDEWPHRSRRAQTLIDRFGSWEKACKLAGIERPAGLHKRAPIDTHTLRWKRDAADRVSAGMGGRQFSEQDLLDQLRACARQLGRTPGHQAFDEWIGVKRAQLLIIRFGTWRRACEQAGLVPHPKPTGMGEATYTDDDTRRAYNRIRDTVGHPPSAGEWQNHRVVGEPHEGTIRRRYDHSWIAFLEEMEGERDA